MYRCGHCIKFAPEFEEASEILKTADPSVALLQVHLASSVYTEAVKCIIFRYNRHTWGCVKTPDFSVSHDVSECYKMKT